MIHSPSNRYRRSIRLQEYDYSQPGAYFVTSVIHQRECILGEVIGGVMQCNDMGKIVEYTWFELINHIPKIELDTFIIMPNHIHGIIVINDWGMDISVGAGPGPTPTKKYPLSEIVRQFKSFSAQRINISRGTPGIPVWQRNYYEHIIRDEKDLDRIREYILYNPTRWEENAKNSHPKGWG